MSKALADQHPMGEVKVVTHLGTMTSHDSTNMLVSNEGVTVLELRKCVKMDVYFEMSLGSKRPCCHLIFSHAT